MQMTAFKKPIHLLYVPTIFCNMGCQYCYLGELTEARPDNEQAVSTLQFTLSRLLDAGYLPFNLSFHGGEVTTLPSKTLRSLFQIAKEHYQQYGESIRQLGFRLNPVHIKTNLLNFAKHYDLFKEFEVSISGSVDLPLHLHDKYRVDKKDGSTLERIENSLRLLANYPHRKKLSCVITQAHLDQVDAFIEAINYIHYDIGLDMTRFNIMFSFDSEQNAQKYKERHSGLTMLNSQGQIKLYQKLKKAFVGTALEAGFRQEWFCEFTPDYCCSAVNCGNKFFLLQYDGSVYSCPRGQSSEQYYYGNIFKDSIDSIINNAWQVIERNENKMDLSHDCLQCEYIHYCHAGCTFVRTETGLKKSYTCDLQKLMYSEDPERYPPMPRQQIKDYSRRILFRNNIHKITQTEARKPAYITPELSSEENSLSQLIAKDKVLAELFGNNLFFLEVNGEQYALESPILKNTHDLEFLNSRSQLILGVHQDAFSIATDESTNNYVLLMMLRDTPVTYGDEGRSKQEHIFDYALYSQSLMAVSDKQGDYYLYDLSIVLKSHAVFYKDGIRNNLFVTTKALREYHYNKHRKNAFYHIQAINLPFPNLEFYWKEF
ncbi:MAG: radical SAM/SPASM domain-containing protein [Proteobacteria bacterium]|nr:MAG: radical SAM/SPASM domain-containing protein [Pseudomonadota bacterium]